MPKLETENKADGKDRYNFSEEYIKSQNGVGICLVTKKILEIITTATTHIIKTSMVLRHWYDWKGKILSRDVNL
jgi:hypothetical protein